VFAIHRSRRSRNFFPGLNPTPCPLATNSLICHRSEKSPVSPAIATDPKHMFVSPVFTTHPRPPWVSGSPPVSVLALHAASPSFVFMLLRTLLRFFALRKNSTLLFSNVSALCVKKKTTRSVALPPPALRRRRGVAMLTSQTSSQRTRRLRGDSLSVSVTSAFSATSAVIPVFVLTDHCSLITAHFPVVAT